MKLLSCFACSLLLTISALVSPRIFQNISHFQNFCDDGGVNKLDFPDFFYYIAFAKTAFISDLPYSNTSTLLADYLCISPDEIKLGFAYPPQVLVLISHLNLLEDLFSLKTLIPIIFLGNTLLYLLIAYLISRLTKFNYFAVLLFLVSTYASFIALISGQLSIVFGFICVLAFYFYQRKFFFLTGLVLSAFLIKAQIGLLLLLFCFSKKRIFLGSATGFLLTSIYPLILFGPSIYKDYFNQFFIKQDKDMFIFAKQAISLPSILWKNNLIENHSIIFLIQGIFFLSGLVLVYLLLRKSNALSIESKFGLLILINILISPYVLIYDYFLCVIALIFLAKQFIKDPIFLALSFAMFYMIGFLANYTSDPWIFLVLMVSYLSVFKSGLILKTKKHKEQA